MNTNSRPYFRSRRTKQYPLPFCPESLWFLQLQRGCLLKTIPSPFCHPERAPEHCFPNQGLWREAKDLCISPPSECSPCSRFSPPFFVILSERLNTVSRTKVLSAKRR